MKNRIGIDYDGDRKDEEIRIVKDDQPPASVQEFASVIILDMATICEGLCTMIHVAEANKTMTSVECLKHCVNYLQSGKFESPSEKNEVVVDIDSSREGACVQLMKSGKLKDSKKSEKEIIILDINTLLKGVSALVEMANDRKIKPEKESIADCIRHLESGFADAEYTTITYKD